MPGLGPGIHAFLFDASQGVDPVGRRPTFGRTPSPGVTVYFAETPRIMSDESPGRYFSGQLLRPKTL